MEPLVSIVMPFRNAASSLAAALSSISAQSLARWELVAIDDGSADDGPHMVAAAAAQDPRVRLIASRGRGIVAALNAGCAAATTPLIARMDADDVMRPTRLERQLALLDHAPGIGVASCLVAHGGDRTRQGGFAAHVEWTNAQVDAASIHRSRFVDSPVPHPSVVFRRELLDRHGGYAEGAFPEDYELWLRWMEAGVRFAKVPEVLLVWNDRPERLSRTDERYSVERLFATKCRYLAADRRRCRDPRAVWLWGAGRVTRRRFDPLAEHGVEVAGYIDIDPRKVGQRVAGRPVVPPTALPPRDESFVIAGVGVRGARDLVRPQLLADGRVEERDFVVAA
ncbi:MAG: glycosyltransferase family 2 protein [Phycisphaerales bacterium]|nr:glycosyltransferase family 2 protein [Phycisphaerales bacterium]